MKKQISVSMIVVLLVALVGMSSTSAWAQPPIPTANLALWLAGDNVNGDSTNPANGAQVTTWVDLSGNGNNLSARTDPADGPTYSTVGGPLGKPTVNFDGVNDELGNYAMTLTSPQFYMVLKGTGGASNAIFLGMAGGQGFYWQLKPDDTLRGWARENLDGNYRTLLSPSTAAVTDYKAVTLFTDIYGDPATRAYPQWLSATVQDDSTSVLSEGAQDYAYGTPGPGYPSDVHISYPGGAGMGNHYYEFVLGGFHDEASFANMSIAEVIIYDNPVGWPMSSVDKASVESYLVDKYFVPEPSTVGLLVTGLLGLLICGRRKRK